VTEATLPRRRVLIAAATADEADSLSALASVWGCEVRTATDGTAALAAVEAFGPQIALLDLRLDGLDGYQVARRLCGASHVERVTLVALAGHDADADRIRARADGFDHFLTLPVDPEALRRIIAG
jgi:DNA-binding response OmpR family regulator